MNRRQRRAQASKTSDLRSADDIPLSRPERATPRTKTLLEIAAERQAQSPATGTNALGVDPINPKDVVTVTLDPDGSIAPTTNPGLITEDESEVSPVLDTLLLAISLSAIHFTLEVLTVHQYAQELSFRPIVLHTIFLALPTLALVIHLFHGHLLHIPLKLSDSSRKFMLALRQTLYVVIANIAGCYLIQLTNDRGYYAVMKNAPSIGTIWVWSVIELGLVGALAGVLGPGLYAWYYEYGII